MLHNLILIVFITENTLYIVETGRVISTRDSWKMCMHRPWWRRCRIECYRCGMMTWDIYRATGPEATRCECGDVGMSRDMTSIANSYLGDSIVLCDESNYQAMYGSTAQHSLVQQGRWSHRDGSYRLVHRWYLALHMCSHPIMSWGRSHKSRCTIGLAIMASISVMNGTAPTMHNDFGHVIFQRRMLVKRQEGNLLYSSK